MNLYFSYSLFQTHSVGVEWKMSVSRLSFSSGLTQKQEHLHTGNKLIVSIQRINQQVGELWAPLGICHGKSKKPTKIQHVFIIKNNRIYAVSIVVSLLNLIIFHFVNMLCFLWALAEDSEKTDSFSHIYLLCGLCVYFWNTVQYIARQLHGSSSSTGYSTFTVFTVG